MTSTLENVPSRSGGRRRRTPRLRAGPQARLPLLVRPGPHRPDGHLRGRGLPRLGRRRQRATSTSPPSWSSPTSATSTPPSCPPSQEQAAKLCTIAPSYANAARSEAARLIAGRTPGDLDKVFFTNGGADANEHAIRMARLHTGRHKVLSTYRSYHGGTQLAINVTGDPRRWASDTASTGTVHFFGAVPLPQRLPRHHRGRGVPARPRAPRAADRFEGPSTIAAIILESDPRHGRDL